MKVQCQTDPKYSSMVSNQCSWCAAEFIKNRKELLNYYVHNNECDLTNLYNKCLLAGSIKRKEYNQRLYGENIDNTTLLDQYDFTVISFMTMIINCDVEFLKLLPDSLKEEFYENKYSMVDNTYFDSHISDGASYLASRHGQSFAIIPFLQNYLILDSHIHETKLLSPKELTAYLYNKDCGHTHVTLLKIC